jgi:uncharacterized protein
MIRINVAQQLREPVGAIRVYRVSETDETNECKVEGELKLVRTDKGILVIGDLATVKKLTCSRCLEIFEHPLSLSLSEEYVSQLDISDDTLLPVSEGLFTVDHTCEICVDDALDQYATMLLPMKPLCKPDCKGLCTRCGFNLNSGDCCCLSATDPRWDGLVGLASAVAKGKSREE